MEGTGDNACEIFVFCVQTSTEEETLCIYCNHAKTAVPCAFPFVARLH